MKKGSRELIGRAAALALTAAFCLPGQPATANQVYTWTDENGVTHFSDRKPPDAETEVIDMEDKPGGVTYSQPQSSADGEADPATADEPLPGQQRREAIAEDSAQRRAEAAEQAAMCDQHRELLARLEPARRVYYTDESGQEARMDDGQRMQAIADAREYIAQNCD
jgi:hypothetical protein